jgi:serine/threonine protein kinase
MDELVAGRYRLDRLIGEGSAARVFHATDVMTGRAVALKALRGRASLVSSAIERFEREMLLLRSLQSDAFIELIDVLRDGPEGQPAFVMELMEGPTLERRLQAEPLSAEDVVELGIRIASGLEIAHARGIVHGDLKPSNIYLPTADVRHAKIGDLGLAERTDSTGQTTTGTVLGTPYYMSPEAARGHSRRPESDIWSLGVVLYECAYGRRPFGGVSLLDVLRNVLTEAPAFEPLPHGLEAVLKQALNKEFSARFASGGGLATALAACRDAHGVSGSAGPMPSPRPAPSPAPTWVRRDSSPAPVPWGTSASATLPTGRARKASRVGLVIAASALLAAALFGAFMMVPRMVGDGPRPQPSSTPLLLQALLIGVAAAIVTRLLIAVIERGAQGDNPALDVAKLSVTKVRSSDILTQSIALTVESLILQSSGDPRVDLRRASLAIAIDELQTAKTLGDRKAALDRAIEIADKVHEQLTHKPWYVQHKDGIALVTAFAGAAAALLSKIIEVTK